jgi:hypothetical protein
VESATTVVCDVASIDVCGKKDGGCGVDGEEPGSPEATSSIAAREPSSVLSTGRLGHSGGGGRRRRMAVPSAGEARTGPSLVASAAVHLPQGRGAGAVVACVHPSGHRTASACIRHTADDTRSHSPSADYTRRKALYYFGLVEYRRFLGHSTTIERCRATAELNNMDTHNYEDKTPYEHSNTPPHPAQRIPRQSGGPLPLR